ncbi:MAG: NADH-quinone oxidoreductase subunit [Candidatus Methanomethylophilaceae archaeon]|nr:NADH-quinone oxidoreductase subunit [Candidatus Methanomethylophilaceae archaeon]MDI3541121.1 NADH-quinone oxidoreductase subunit [Candidatus Methanomethylophilaceae archaeon]HIJ00543.1 4Fe-4S binding protein [Candidatus Methanomethylophilaceae archaeon]
MALKFLDKYPKNTARHLWVLRPLYATLKNMIRTTIHRPVTIMYPYEKEWIPDNYRGRPGLVFEKCLGCGICESMCPTTCIEMVEVDDEKLGKVRRPQVNVGRCMMCGYCAEYCPVNAMTVTPDYELAAFTREDLIFDPYRLKWENVTQGMEVHLEEHLPSNLAKGIYDQPTAYFKVDRPKLIEDKCISCARCSKTCPVGAIEMVEVGVNEKGKPIKHPKVDDSKCVFCQQCINICPKSALEINEVL